MSDGLPDLLGGRLAAEHPIALGHHDIAVMAGESHASTGIERTRSFRETWSPSD